MAYLLSTAEDAAVRDPARALELAQQAVAAGYGGAAGSRNAAFLDTLAQAYFAAGDPKQALFVQRSALALANSEGLGVYLQHYDMYAAAAGETETKKNGGV